MGRPRSRSPDDDVGVGARHRRDEGPVGLVDQEGVDRHPPDLGVVIAGRCRQQLLDAGRLALAEDLRGGQAEIGIGPAERRPQRLLANTAGPLHRELKGLRADARIGVGEELQEQLPGPSLLDLTDHLAEHLAANVGVR